MNFKEENILIMIKLHKARNWLYKLRYEDKDLHKDIFVDKYE